MPKKRHLGLDPAGGGKAAKAPGAKDAVTRHDDWHRVRAAGLADRLRGGAKFLRQIAIGSRFAKGIAHIARMTCPVRPEAKDRGRSKARRDPAK